MNDTTQNLINKMCNKEEDNAYFFADKLATLNSPDSISPLIELLGNEDPEIVYLAARSLGKMEDNMAALEPLLEQIHNPKNKNTNGALVQTLDGYDLSDYFVDLFRIYLFGNFKSSALAKEMLDTLEFNMTPRVLKKLNKHWKHFQNNTDQTSEEYQLKQTETDEMFDEISEILSTD